MEFQTGHSSSILRPAKPSFILFSLLAATLLEMIPVDRSWITPDFLALVLVFWNIRQPRFVGIGVSWFFGLMMDIHSASLLGEHALAYAIMSFLAILSQRRVQSFTAGQLSLHIIPILFVGQWTTLAIRMLMGAQAPGFIVLLEPLLTAALWPFAQFVLLIPQRMPSSKDRNRPI